MKISDDDLKAILKTRLENVLDELLPEQAEAVAEYLIDTMTVTAETLLDREDEAVE